ncbi:MAG: hypothetical protein IJ496_00560 [Ruminococcus sp.]|nr:hypothetical protein [Ruminococcus sp.]
MPKDEKLNEKLDELIQAENEKKAAENTGILFLPVCISLGASLGLIIGSAAGNLSMGLCIGLAGGCAAYGAVSLIRFSRKKAKQPDSSADKNEDESSAL